MPGDLSEYSVIQTKEPLIAKVKSAALLNLSKNRISRNAGLRHHGRWSLCAFCRYLAELERTQPGAWGRIQLTDAIASWRKNSPLMQC